MTQQLLGSIESTIAELKSLCDRAQGCWEDAISCAEEQDHQERVLRIEVAEEECIDAWVDAIHALQHRDYSSAIQSLNQASYIAKDFGDNQHEQEAIHAVITASIQVIEQGVQGEYDSLISIVRMLDEDGEVREGSLCHEHDRGEWRRSGDSLDCWISTELLMVVQSDLYPSVLIDSLDEAAVTMAHRNRINATEYTVE